MIRHLVFQRLIPFVVLALLGIEATTLAAESPQVAYIRTAKKQDRQQYLAQAVIWRDPGSKTPEELLNGPRERFPLNFQEANTPEGLPCTYETPGNTLGGMTPKFICRTPDGQSLRVKYFSGPGGNREVFAEVATTRLLWALGFDADAVFPITVDCIDCPENPETGRGERRDRVFLGLTEPHYEGTLILSAASELLRIPPQKRKNLPCIGNITVSNQAAEEGEPDPPITNAAQQFLLEQLRRLSDEHLRAIFRAARVETLEENRHEDPDTGKMLTGIDVWVAAFRHRVNEIEDTRCGTAELVR